MKRKSAPLAALLLSAALFASLLAGCAPAATAPSASAPAPTPSAAQPTDTATPQGKKVLLAVSFGTSYDDNRDKSIGAIETALQAAFPEYEVRRAFTSQIIIDILAGRGLVIDNVGEAMERLLADGVTDVIVQPTHVMNGFEYDDVINEITPYAEKFDSFKVGRPLLITPKDYAKVVNILVEETSAYQGEDTAIVLMGHGTHHAANATYEKLQSVFTAAGHDRYFVGTVEASPSLEDVIPLVQASGAKKVVLLPLMIVAGDHANNDMAGDEADSWKSAFTAAGFEVEVLLQGMGQYQGIQDLIVEHAKEATSSVAVGAVKADRITDGTYAIDVTSSSSMFNITKAELQVKDGAMSCVLTLSGTGYEKLYLGTGEEALADSDDKCIYFVADSEGAYTYTVPVESLNVETNVAAWSIRKQTWYDRVLVFQSSLMPEGSIAPK